MKSIRSISRRSLLSVFVAAQLVTACATQPVAQFSAPESQTRIDKPLTIVAVGDTMMDGTARPEFKKFGYDYPFVHVGKFIERADIAIANLEGPLTKRGSIDVEKKYVFRSPPDKVASALAKTGFDVFSLANNHTLDYGVQGLTDTIDALNRHGLAYSGAGMDLASARKPVVIERKGKRVAFLAYSLTFPEEFWAKKNQPGTAFGHEAHVRKDVANAKKEADIVIVSFHWGREGTTELRPYQTALGRAAIDEGAAAVVGHHPHILQGIERYKHGVILYSLGNFVFGSYSYRAKRAAIAELVFDGNLVKTVRMIPINVFNPEVVFQPQVLTGEKAAEVINELSTLSQPLGVAVGNDKDIAIIGENTQDVSLLAQ
ncbi:MAG: CapA family protein [Proteobacteria bacterium]|nr:CapA family protein [Pseudomonadota bacterium]